VTQEATQQEQASQEQDIETLFNEAAGITPASEEQTEDTAKASKDEGQQGEETGAEADLDLLQNTVKSDASQEEGSEAEGAKPAPEKTETPATSWRDSLAPEVKAEIEKIEAESVARDEEIKKLRHKARSDAGRVAALTRQMDELRRAAQGSAKAKSAEAVLEETRQKYPEIAEAIDVVRAEQHSTEERARALEQQRAQEEAQKRHAAVEAAHPGWKALLKSPVFQTWYGAAPEDIKALGSSTEPEHAIHLLDAFKEANPATSEVVKEAEEKQPAPTQEQKPASGKTAAEIAAERAKKLEAARGVETKPAARESTTEAGGDVEALFDAETRRRERETKGK
jgi:hypothetical protein